MRTFLKALGAACLTLCPALAQAVEVQGDYIEARNADVFTGPCFSNAEIFIYGKQAVMAWKVNRGSWKGVDVAGLCVAAAVQGDSTFGQDNPSKARAVLIVDSRADERQRAALVDMAKTFGGKRVEDRAPIVATRMQLNIERGHAASADEHRGHDMPETPRASFWAAGIAQIVTRSLDDRDHFCGNEVVAYPPLSTSVEAKPAYTLSHEFKGDGLDIRWDDPNCRSSFVGHFEY
jgi:Protein of unknown function (DUF1326)